jgi:hypothetical protein
VIKWKMTRIRFREADLTRLDEARKFLQGQRKSKVYRASLIRRYVREGLERDLAAAASEDYPSSPTGTMIPLS